MLHKVSLSGITTLKQSRFKTRHNKLKEITQTPREHIITTKHYKTLDLTENDPKPQKKRRHKKIALQEKKLKTQASYRIDKKKIKDRIKAYLLSMKGEKMLYFWTVTFPKGTPDSECYYLFQRWMDRLRKEKMLKEYLWITERQQNGTIHYHLAVNNKMDVRRANVFMRAAIMTAIDRKDITWTRDAAMKYNGVDISKNRKTKRVTNFAKGKNEKQLMNYLTKYVTKNQDTYQHLAWHNSRGYSNLIVSVNLTSSEFIHYQLTTFLDHDRVLEDQFFEFRRWAGGPPGFVTRYFESINQYVQSILN